MQAFYIYKKSSYWLEFKLLIWLILVNLINLNSKNKKINDNKETNNKNRQRQEKLDLRSFELAC
jgi:hypothetical protein